jgi:hypothetical protein
VGQWAVDNLGLKDGGPGFKVGDGNPILDAWRTWGRARPAAAPAPAAPAKEFEFGEMGELEQETYLGPLTATLTWRQTPYTRDEVVKKARYGGVYIAFQAPAQKGGKIKILKVGMTSTFARRMGDKKYIEWDKQYPGLRFYLAEVRGNRGNRGIGGVVRMVEHALARLLRRTGELTGSQLPKVPVVTKGAIKITNVLPDALVGQLTKALRTPLPKEDGKPGGMVYTGTITPGQLALPIKFNWEAEQAFG